MLNFIQKISLIFSSISNFPFIRKMIKKLIRPLLWDYCHPYMAKRYYKRFLGRDLDLKNPRDINEKIQWLLCYYDTSKWADLTDKYKVRDFVKSCGFEDMLITLYGDWEKAELIDFDSLPDKFVLKCNHDSGSCKIIDKRIGYDKKEIIDFYNKRLKIKYGYQWGELYYNKIKPRIIAEEYLSNDCDSSLIDYKIWCFDGKPYSIHTYYDRNGDSASLHVYSLEWESKDDSIIDTKHYRKGSASIPKPDNLNDMLNVASLLSKGLPEVRVDLYETNGQLYFGELTFCSGAGYMDNFTSRYLLDLGQRCILPHC